jgi:hypothetical protein
MSHTDLGRQRARIYTLYPVASLQLESPASENKLFETSKRDQ